MTSSVSFILIRRNLFDESINIELVNVYGKGLRLGTSPCLCRKIEIRLSLCMLEYYYDLRFLLYDIPMGT